MFSRATLWLSTSLPVSNWAMSGKVWKHCRRFEKFQVFRLLECVHCSLAPLSCFFLLCLARGPKPWPIIIGGLYALIWSCLCTFELSCFKQCLSNVNVCHIFSLPSSSCSLLLWVGSQPTFPKHAVLSLLFSDYLDPLKTPDTFFQVLLCLSSGWSSCFFLYFLLFCFCFFQFCLFR